MTVHSLPRTWKKRSRVVSGLFRAFTFSLLIAAFASTSLHAQTVAYVTNNGGNSVSVIDTSTNTVTATIPVGGFSPIGVALTPDGTRAYVTSSSGLVSVIDTASNTVAATINFPNPLGFPAITPDGKSVYVSTFNRIFVIDTATNSVVSTISDNNPFAVAITPDGSLAYVLGFNNVAVVDTATNTVVQTIGVSSDTPLGPLPNIAITPDGGTVYLGGGGNASVQAISTASNSVVATVPISGTFGVFGLAVSPDGSRVYVSDVTGKVHIIDTATNTLEPSTIPVGSFPIGVAVTPDGALVYVANQNSNNLSVISTASNTVVATVPAGRFPYGITIFGPPVVPASGTGCNGTFNGTFNGNLTVSAGQMCKFVGGGVTGNVQQGGGNLTLIRTKVGGNLQISGASTFSVGPGTSVSGDLQVQNLPASAAQNQICGSSVHGNLVFQNSGTALLIGASSSCPGNTVGNDLTVQNNTAATSIIGNTVTGNLVDQGNTAPTQVFNNIVGNNLQCASNTSISGGGNTAKSKQGQCTNF